MTNDHPQSSSIERATPADLRSDEYHIRGEPDLSPNEPLVRSVRQIGVIVPPIARRVAGELRIIDGMRRVRAAEMTEKDTIPIQCREYTNQEAGWASLTANQQNRDTEPVSDADRQESLRRLGAYYEREEDGPEAPPDSLGTIQLARRRLGIDSIADHLLRSLGHVHGLGPATAGALAEAVGDLSNVRAASLDELRDVSGVGETLGIRLREHFVHEPEKGGAAYLCECGWSRTVSGMIPCDDDGQPQCGECGKSPVELAGARSRPVANFERV